MQKYNKETVKDMPSLKGQEFTRSNKDSSKKPAKPDRESALKSEKARFEGDKILMHATKSNCKVKVKIKNPSKKKEQSQAR